MMKAEVIRQKWFDFFAEKKHQVQPSASLVPHNDPTLLWINAGMAPLKPYFDGREKPQNPRIANVQKCIRTNDIENVGKTKRHQTFFEMMGNFSIGDYFKKEAISWAWEFLTSPQWIGFEKERLSVTVYPEDTEAFQYWNEIIGIPEKRIYKLEENFWDIGEGPCGPCTEIFYDRGDAYGDLSDPECWPGGENERFLEVWNLVFSQFNHNQDGSYTPLPKKNIDTGAGLERFALICQDVDSNFDTDLILPIIEKTCGLAGIQYHASAEQDVALKVIADHIRTVVFAAGDGVLPSNEGRGYVIRRLLRRAVRYGKVLGIEKPFLYQLTDTVGEIMGRHYPDIVEKKDLITKVIRLEEERFHETLSDGLAILTDMIEEAKKEGRSAIHGAQAFKLYDTYGFPLDLTEDFAGEQGFDVDSEGFASAMEEQRERARSARQDQDSMNVQGGALADFSESSEFIGYDKLQTQSKVIALIEDNQSVEGVKEGTECQVILDQTPFYAESGGQVADQGIIRTEQAEVRVLSVSKAPHGQHVHAARVVSGELRNGDVVKASVDEKQREEITKNHTATHLMHKALKEVLGTHANQAGSLVEAERLRFDFSHFGSISGEELTEIERKVNEQIWLSTNVVIEHMAIDESKSMGAMALFGEKYGDVVRVVQVADYSIELCGGCHVGNTAQIGLFKIISESGIGSGIRRIEAVTGRNAYEYVEKQLQQLQEAANLLKSNVSDVPKKLEAAMVQWKEVQRENESLRAKLSRVEAGSLSERVRTVGGISLITAVVQAADMDTLRNMADELKNKLQSGIIVLGAAADNKVSLIAAVTPDLTKQGYHAGKIIKEAASICGGGGGGRPDMAQAGGKNPDRLADALQHVDAMVEELASK